MRKSVREVHEILADHGVDCLPENPGVKQIGTPFFTGWKGVLIGEDGNPLPIAIFYLDMNDYVDIPETAKVEVVGQWVCFLQKDEGRIAMYVNLPNMACGAISEGACFDIGGTRISRSTPRKEIEQMLVDGYEKLLEIVALEKSKAA